MGNFKSKDSFNMDLLKDYWELIATILAGAAWVGRLSSRISALEGKDCVMEGDCKERRDVNTSEFQHIREDISAIKMMMIEQDRRNDERHKAMIDHIIEISKHLK